MLGSMSFNSFIHFRQLAVAYLVREQLFKNWYEFQRAYSMPKVYDRQPITRFDRLLAAHSTVPTERLYHIWSEVTDRRMARFGRVRRMTVEPALTHREACTVLSKHTQYRWRRMWLVEVGSAEEQRLIAQRQALAAADRFIEECVPVSTDIAAKIEQHVLSIPPCAECGGYRRDRVYVDREASQGTTIYFTVETCRTCVGRGRP
mgnify:FL=1